MGRVKICIYSDQHSWSLSSLQRPFCAATRRLERGREINCAKEDFFFSWQSEDSTVGAFYYRKKIFFNTIKSSPVITFAVIRSPYFNEAAYLFLWFQWEPLCRVWEGIHFLWSRIWTKYAAGFGKTHNNLMGCGIWPLLGKQDSQKSWNGIRYWEWNSI